MKSNMKNGMRFFALGAALFGAALTLATPVLARDSVSSYSIEAALHSDPGKVNNDVALYFAGQSHPSVIKRFGEFGTNKKTSAFARSDAAACQRAFLSAVLELQERARKEGANAVINIKSNYKKQLSQSASEYTCGSGAVIAGVALVGEVVTVSR